MRDLCPGDFFQLADVEWENETGGMFLCLAPSADTIDKLQAAHVVSGLVWTFSDFDIKVKNISYMNDLKIVKV